MRRPLRSFLVIASAFAFLAAATASFAVAGKAWTVMVYMMADNDLEESAVADLDEMAASNIGDSCNLVILADRGSLYTSAPAGGLPAWSGAKLLVASGGHMKELADWGNTDLGKPETLARFVADRIVNNPAQRYALLFWDHGGAWTGFGIDESAGSRLHIGQIEEGIKAGLGKAGRAKLDLLGFDACLMGNFDTISRLDSLASFYLASEELEPGHGWDYRSLGTLKSKPESSALELGTALIDGYMKQAAAEKNGDRIMLALVDLEKFGALEKAVGEFAAAAKKDISSFAPGLGRGVGLALAFGKAGNPEQDSHLVDLGSFAIAAAKECPSLAPRRDTLLKALKAAIPVLRKGSILKESTGISVYFPNRSRLYNKDCRSKGQGDWVDFLDAYFSSAAESQASLTAPRFDAVDNEGEAWFEEGWMYLSGNLVDGSSAGVVDATFYYGIVEGDQIMLLGDDEASFDDETGEVTGAWDGLVLRLSQGNKETWGYLSLSETEEGNSLYSIPFAYFKSGAIDEDSMEYAWLDLVVDGNDDIVSSTLYKETDDDLMAELKPVKGSKLVPLIDIETADGDIEQVMTEDWGFDARDWESIEIDFEEVESGTPVYLELYVTDAMDEGDYLYAESEWP